MRLISNKDLVGNIRNTDEKNVFMSYFSFGVYSISIFPLINVLFMLAGVISGVYDIEVLKEGVHLSALIFAFGLVFVDNILMKTQESNINKAIRVARQNILSFSDEAKEQDVILSEKNIKEAIIGKERLVNKSEINRVFGSEFKDKVISCQDIKVSTSEKIHMLRQYKLLCLKEGKKVISNSVYYVDEDEIKETNARKLINRK